MWPFVVSGNRFSAGRNIHTSLLAAVSLESWIHVPFCSVMSDHYLPEALNQRHDNCHPGRSYRLAVQAHCSFFPNQIRHGESLDNTVSISKLESLLSLNYDQKGIWAGWKDAPLSRLGECVGLQQRRNSPPMKLTDCPASRSSRSRLQCICYSIHELLCIRSPTCTLHSSCCYSASR